MQKRPAERTGRIAGSSLPPASPHRAGHSFGLHPEDQPYQSSKIIVRHSVPVETGRWPQAEPKHIVFPDTDEAPVLKMYREVRSTHHTHPPLTPKPSISFYPYARRRPWLSNRLTSLILGLSCLFFLLASSIIAFVLIGSHNAAAEPFVQATPAALSVHEAFTLSGHGFGSRDLMTFTYDGNQIILNQKGVPLETHSDTQGNFAIQISVPDSWTPGLHTIRAVDEAQGPVIPTTITVISST